MQEKLKSFGAKLKGIGAKMSKKVRIALGCLLAVLLVGGIAFAVYANTRPYAVLFTGLSTEEISSITTYLNDNGATDFRIQGTDTILVPQAQEAQLKADLLMQGYPTSGFAYETYRKGVGAMSTDSDRQMAYLQDLQDRMAGVIRCMDGVKSAVVTIAQGEDRRYVLDSSNAVDASASVMVTMNGGGRLSDQQAAAIRNLVAHGVQGLEIDNIAISDSLGDSYAKRFGEVAPIINNGVAEVEQKDYFNTSTPQGVHLSQVHQQHLTPSPPHHLTISPYTPFTATSRQRTSVAPSPRLHLASARL